MPAANDIAPAPRHERSDADWERLLSGLLEELSGVQTDLLALLAKKRAMLMASDRVGLVALQPEEEKLTQRLSDCQERRAELLAEAGGQGKPKADLRMLAASLEGAARLRPALRSAQQRARLVQHHSLANWVLVQRTLLHLSQMVEIVATGGRKPPTYQKKGPAAAGGSLLDHAV
ncbi:flagellar protein FlgN [Botrimarina hoheduenensis]|uniref:FlgN protein n=1 Tax=Botrimarina hoheduenensis TaxID=2528000 RepID=A0A5C5VY77_9BACT|nr:flagellar protein FlgN [Botrimarina hoheduenensis]TWT42691.1 FlgN protein [Botrimarina hoheduenensis]